MRIILFLLVGWYTIGNIQAQIKEPVKFKNELKMTSETEAEIVFTASIEKGWHVYSTGLGDDGPISATFNINASSHVETMGKLQPVGKEISIYDKMFEMNVRYFEDTVQFIQKVKFTGNDYFIEGFPVYGTARDWIGKHCNCNHCIYISGKNPYASADCKTVQDDEIKQYHHAGGP